VGLYGRFVVPRLINFAMKQSMLRERRAALVPRAKGTVLEVGIGSGLNLPYYSHEVERLYGVDPSPQLLAMARSNARKAQLAVELVCESAERLPFADASFDCAIMTWTLCSIPHAGRALREVHRALVEATRAAYERDVGPAGGPGQMLKLLTEDPYFAWLHPMSELIVDLDSLLTQELLPSGTVAAVRMEINRLTQAGDSPFWARYGPTLQADASTRRRRSTGCAVRASGSSCAARVRRDCWNGCRARPTGLDGCSTTGFVPSGRPCKNARA